MYPPAPGTFPRTVPPGGAIICGIFVPGGYSVGVNQSAITRSEENFKFPNEFHPERWMGDERFASDRRKACQPFSYGPRNCIGKRCEPQEEMPPCADFEFSLAYAEMKLVLVKLLWHFDAELHDDSRSWAEGQKMNMFWEKNDMNVKLTQCVR